MKLYIVGPVASGKSTLTKRISSKWNIPFQSLDELVHIPDKTHPWGNRKRLEEERDMLFHAMLQRPEWILEDVGRACFEKGLEEAEEIILLEPSSRVRKYRIIKRWIRQRIGLERCIYHPGFKMLKGMFRWSNDYDSGKDGLMERIHKYEEKVLILRSKREIEEFILRRSKGDK